MNRNRLGIAWFTYRGWNDGGVAELPARQARRLASRASQLQTPGRIARLADRLIGKLSPECREAVILWALQGESTTGVARRLGWTDRRARSRVRRGLVRLSGLLSRRGIVISSRLVARLLRRKHCQVSPIGADEVAALACGPWTPPCVARLASAVLGTDRW